MVTWHRHLEGEEDRFAIEISFARDPEAGAFAEADVSQSWGTLRLVVRSAEPTRATGPTGEALTGVTWYLLPLLEWFVSNWDALLHETRPPTRESSENTASDLARNLRRRMGSALGSSEQGLAYWKRHSIAAARNGGIFPNVVFRRIANDIEISWDDAGRPGTGKVHFLSASGSVRVPVDDFSDVVLRSLSAACDALLRTGESPRLNSLAKEISAIDNPSARRIELRGAWLLGLRERPDETLATWKHLSGRGTRIELPASAGAFSQASLPSVMFSSASPHLDERDIARLTSISHDTVGIGPDLEPLVRSVPCPLGDPWQSGYDLALELREQLGLGAKYVSVREVIEKLGIPVHSIHLGDAEIRGVSLVHADATLVALNDNSTFTKRAWSREAILAHELCHVLYDRNLGTDLAVISGPWAPKRLEQRANAFSAMFRMPIAGVEKVVLQAGDVEDRVLQVSKAYGTSYTATAYHLGHLGYLNGIEVEAILEALSSGSEDLGDSDHGPGEGTLAEPT